MASVKVDCMVRSKALVGEGPVWEESERSLLFIDIVGHKIHRWDSNTDQIQSLDTGGTVGFAVPRGSGGYVAGVGRKIVAVDWSSQTMTTLAEVDEDKPNNELNDGKVDAFGHLVTGTLGKEVRPDEFERHQGALYSLAPDLTVTKHFNQVDISNGMDWSLDYTTFYYIDTLAMSIDAFDYQPTSATRLGNRRVVYRMEEGEGLPDGMTVDAKGHLWVACSDGGRVINIDPAVGVRLQTVSLPVTKTTSCCFGGPDYRELYVTSASLGLSQSEMREQPLAGNIFKVTGLEVKGRPSHAFSG